MALSAVGFIQGTGVVIPGDIATDPVDGTLLADSGPLVGSSYLFAVSTTMSVAGIIDVQIRNATNTASTYVMRRRVGPGNDDFIFPNKLPMAMNQRIRVVLIGSMTGEVQSTIFLMEVSS